MPKPIRIRMYRTGFGDCFLVTFGADQSARHILVDFGVHAQGDIGTMSDIMSSIEEATDKKLELIIATHAHRDHISGFGSFAARFAEFKIGEVWMPWTDDPKDKDASAVKKKHLALYDILENHLRIALGARESMPEYAAALNALSNLKGNETATTELARGFGTGADVRYLKAGTSISKVAEITGLSAEILAPSKDKTFLSRMNPPADQHFMTSPGDTSHAIQPFPKLAIRDKDRDFKALVKDGQPVLPKQELAKLRELAETPAGRLALALDSMRNNTSLVVLFRFQGKTLLFPGDAQWGNWQSWIGTDGARQLIGGLDFLKVAHHGSENATPVDVVNGLREAGLAVMVPTQIKPFPTIPRMPLIKQLEKHCLGHLAVRSDWIDVADAPRGPAAKPKFPQGFKRGKIWIDYEF